MRVLVIEDDTDISSAIASMLARQRYAVDVASDGQAGLDQLLGGSYDVAIVDIALPGRDGFSICRAARAERVPTPVLMLTARDAVEDRIRGLDAGADDYLIKPFDAEELAARVRALLRRAERPPQPAAISVGSLVVDANARTVTIAGIPLELGTPKFLKRYGITISRVRATSWTCT
jgi:DNA-binding response OmpR family regulator